VHTGQAAPRDAGRVPAAAAAPARRSRRLGVAAGIAVLATALALVASMRKPVIDDLHTAKASAAVQWVDGKRLADTGNYQAAIDRFNRALLIDAKSVDALLNRADAHAKLGETVAALADLTRAAELAPQDPRPHLQRARVRADGDDAFGALADIAAVERAGGTLDLPAWTLRARLFAETGATEAALAAYGRVIDLGAVAEGQIGKAQILERADRTEEAVAAYRVAIESTSDTRLRTLAEARLKQLVPEARLSPVRDPVAQITLLLTSHSDAPLADAIGPALGAVGMQLLRSKTGFAYELVGSNSTRGGIRYFSAEDKSLAQRAQIAVQDALASQGFDRTLTLLYVNLGNDELKATPRGRLEIWLPPIASVRGLRFDVFVCERSGKDALATAQQIGPILKRLEAMSMTRTLAEPDRLARFGQIPNGLEIRYTKAFTSELLAAKVLAGEKDFAALGHWRLVPVSQQSRGYMSLFVCPEAAGSAKTGPR